MTIATDVHSNISLSFFSTGMALSGSWWVVGRAQIQAFTFSWPRLSIKITVGYLSRTYPTFRREKLAHMCRTLIVFLQTKWLRI